MQSLINNNRDVKTKDSNGNQALNVVIADNNSGNTGPFGVFDEIAVTYPTTTTEIYDYLLASSSIGTVTVTYAAANKKEVTNVSYNAV